MLRFDDSAQRRPRNYLARREQYRLLALVAAAGAVILLIEHFASDNAPSAPDSAGGASSVVESSGVHPPAEPGAVVAAVDKTRLSAIRDNSPFRKDETDAWFYLFSLIQAQGPVLPPTPATTATYTQLVAQPQTYRGQLVRVSGEVKRIEAISPAENDLGIQTLYRVMLEPPGRSPWPITVYCLELPSGWSPGNPRSNQVDVTGYFFKNHSYAWQDGMAISPVIVAQSLSVRELQLPKVADTIRAASVWKVFVAAAVIAVAIVAFVLWRTAGPAAPERNTDAAQISAALHRLAQEES